MRIHHSIAAALFSVFAGLTLANPADALCVLDGYVSHVYLNAQSGEGRVYIVDQFGNYVGSAVMPNVGTVGAMTVAFETFRDNLIHFPPYQHVVNVFMSYFVANPAFVGHGVVVNTDETLGFGTCNFGVPNPLHSFTVRY